MDFAPEDIPDTVREIASITGKYARTTKPGDIWTKIDMSISEGESEVCMDVTFTLFWNETKTPLAFLRSKKERQLSQEVIDTFYPSTNTARTREVWSPMDFYDAAYVPPKDETPSIDVWGLEATLFPYQKRTLQWLLKREGVKWSEERAIVEPLPFDEFKSEIGTCRTVQDASSHDVFLSDMFHTLSTDAAAFQQGDPKLKGGILAEEMGLGKTLEVLALILTHKRDLQPSEQPAGGLIPSSATLIVAPESLRAQWVSEISRHAPGLRVKHYQGCKKMTADDPKDIVQELAAYDVVVTTYTVLSAEIHFALEPPERSRRHERQYERLKSPLVQISWWRVCLDEAQMIENGVSKAASVARMIPRINAWGITGTPVKDNVDDLFGLLLFLLYEPYCSFPHIWQALVMESAVFRQLFNSIALRHTKALVRDEILLPAQKRYVISMPFTAVEEQHYQTLFKEMAEACDLDLDGAPLLDDWDPDDHVETMRTWLNRLRQTALHPEVGGYNRRILGQSRNRPMRTVEEVLNAMLDQSENSIRTEERAYLSHKLTRGQLYENSPRVKEALAIWEETRKETEKLVAQAREKLREEVGGNPATQGQDDMAELDSDDENDSPESKGRPMELRRRLRSALELHHKAVFFCANAYFQIRDNAEMTEPDSEEFQRLKKLEDDGYEDAKVLRREILRGSHRKATRLMNELARKASDQSFSVIPELVADPDRGIESGPTIDGLEVLYGQLNDQAAILDDWREDVIKLLLRPLVDEEGDVETTGEELMDSAKMQDELMVYVQALRAAIADRQDAISGQTNELVKHETETSRRMALNEEGPAPKKLLELLQRRAELKPVGATSMRGAITDLRSLQVRLNRDRPDTKRELVELAIVAKQLKHAQAMLQEQNKVAIALESEIESFTTAMNNRLEYYRQLQAVSDSVLPYEGLNTEAVADKLKKSEEAAWRKLSSAEAKHRYLLNLKEAGSKSSEPRMCVICQMPFVTGVLTVCGHEFCKECMMMWFKAHHNCPVCKRALKSSNLHDITIKPQQLQVHSEEASRAGREGQSSFSASKPSDLQKKTMIYSEFNTDKLDEIKNIELEGPSFTTKVDTLVRHLLWLRESDPGAKSIIFSQYKDFLHVLQNAFRRFKIGYASIDEPNGISKFKNDASAKCFLLHARAHSSGLNLVNASHVFLCEPLLNTALELQAIARVDRIGQRNETTVWLYVVSGTVEESIYNLSVRRRMEHMGNRTKSKSRQSTPELLDASIDEANTLEMEHAALSKLMSKDRTAGEVVDQSDLWQCLFGHVGNKTVVPERDTQLQERAVMGYLAGEAAKSRQ
ncbi:putative SNF2 family helicase/ATPase [Stachybotrys elegans]|uniref:SNF2 family helicase/ATPase n=1 Tax=Stachybotrys elegans TaxID=80388 RepID=A0A8K0SS96_9HYPO|nr:putative SNF2 family helicase/ATPase [Stachybotrys elegans]